MVAAGGSTPTSTPPLPSPDYIIRNDGHDAVPMPAAASGDGETQSAVACESEKRRRRRRGAAFYGIYFAAFNFGWLDIM